MIRNMVISVVVFLVVIMLFPAAMQLGKSSLKYAKKHFKA